MISQIVTAVAIVAALRPRSEEVAGRAEPLLAGPVSRLRWATGHLVVALASPVIALLALGGVGAGLGSGLTGGDLGHQLPRVILSTLAYVPATWVLVGLAVALFGLLPRLAATLTWTVLGLFLLVDLLAEFKVIDNPSYLSPYAATPDVLISSGLAPLNLLWLTLIAAVRTRRHRPHRLAPPRPPHLTRTASVVGDGRDAVSAGGGGGCGRGRRR